jgi:hypothetical protein
MAVIYLVHPRHGAKVAISEEEAINDSMYGWSRIDDPAMLAEEVEEEPAPRRRSRVRAAQEE